MSHAAVMEASLEGGEPKQQTFDKELMGFPTWSPDGEHLAFQMKRSDSRDDYAKRRRNANTIDFR